MSRFVWTKALDVGFEAMNEEHKRLIDRMEMLRLEPKVSKEKQKVLQRFDELIDFTSVHFQDEEKLMKKLKYPDLDQHQKLHQSLIKTLQQYKKEYEDQKEIEIPKSVHDFLKLWLTSHIMLVDRKYDEFAKNGVTEELTLDKSES